MKYSNLLQRLSKKIKKKPTKLLDPSDLRKVQKQSLLYYYGNIHSQCGQDGILSEIFRRLDIESGYFLEFGGWDGVYLSNCRFLYEKGCQEIKKYYQNIDIINEMVGYKNSTYLSLDNILLNNNIISDKVDFLSIDIDGFDFEIFNELNFKPKVILIEGGFNFSPYLNPIIDISIKESCSSYFGLQQPISYLFEKYIMKGYTPVCFLQDTFLVRSDLYSRNLFPFTNNSIELFKDAYYFMDNNWRNDLLIFRSSNKIIKRVETDYFGHFNTNPLSYNK